jgi:hypothetical protein
VVVGPSGGEAAGASLQGLAQKGAHLGDVVVGGGLAGDGAVTHHVDAQRIVGDLRDQVHGVGKVERVEVAGEVLPGPADALGEHAAGDVLHALHELDESRAIAGPHRREADAAVAHHAGGDTVGRRRQEVAVPGRLTVVVAVHVDEARRHDGAFGVDDVLGLHAGQTGRELDDAAIGDADVGAPRGAAGAIDQLPATNDEV